MEEGQVVLPYEVHVHWEFSDEEMGSPFEFKVEIHRDNSDASISQVVELSSDHRRRRVRFAGLSVPGVGAGYVHALWRGVGDEEWQEGPIKWPLDVSVQATDPEPQLPLPV